MINNNETRVELLERTQNARKPRVFADYLDGFTISVIGFLLVVVFMTYLLEVTLNSNVSWKDIGVRSALLYICTVSISILLRNLALRKGRKTSLYVEAKSAVDNNNQFITDNNLSIYRNAYCSQWETEELNCERARVLGDYGLNLEDFNNKYCKYDVKELEKMEEFKDLTAHQLKGIKKVQKIKRLKYDVNYLSVSSISGKRATPSSKMSTSTINKIKNGETLITSLIASVFMVYIGIEATLLNSFENVVACLIKIASIVLFGVIAVVNGYNFAVEKEVEELNEKAHEQKAFIDWCKLNKQ